MNLDEAEKAMRQHKKVAYFHPFPNDGSVTLGYITAIITRNDLEGKRHAVEIISENKKYQIRGYLKYVVFA